MNEIRLLFTKADGTYTVSLRGNWSTDPTAPVPFDLFLTDEDFNDLQWYLEDFMDLPDGGSLVRAQRIERDIDRWGHQLHDAIFSIPANKELLAPLRQRVAPHMLTIATSELPILRLPWELMADGAGALCFQGISIRRQLPDAAKATHRSIKLPLRILLVVSRPADQGFIDPRLLSASLLDALKPLGDNATVDFVRPPTLAQLQVMLAEAERRNDPYDIVHFEGHGTFLPDVEIGALCFEQPDADVLAEAQTHYVRADTLGQILTKHRIPLVILEACRSGTLGKAAVFRAVAPRLIEAGVGSVISMGHAVHVEAASIFLEHFYRTLVKGQAVGQAIEQGRSQLLARPARWLELGPGARTVELQDWFVPHLYQRGEDQPILPTVSEVPDKFDVFLSHNSADKPRVERLALLLKNRHGLRVWFDAWEVQRGLLHEQCVEGVSKSRVTLLVCTKQAFESNWVKAEKNWAFAADPTGQNVLPIVLEEIPLPADLQALRWVDCKDPAKDADQASEIARLVGPPLAAPGQRTSRAPGAVGETGAFPRPPRYGFQGRARELYQLERQFRSHRAILLHAMGGMGKTALATEAAHWWTRTGLFPDGACFLSFEQFAGADRIVQVLGEYLDGVNFNSLPIEEQHRHVKELFQKKRVLMVWDNFESVLPEFQRGEKGQAVPMYSDEERNRIRELFRDLTDARDGTGRLLVTCRPRTTAESLLVTTYPFELHGLARPDSLSLLVHVMEKSAINAEEGKLTRERLNPLLDLLADHPLSIELVGPHQKNLTPEAICKDFGKLLAEFKTGEARERNESLLASLAFSTRRLSKEAQDAMPWLGLFSGGVFEQVLLDVSEMDPKQWEAVRAELEATALVRVERDIDMNGRPYLRFHPTLAYAAATGDVPDEKRKRFIGVYLGVRRAVYEALRGSQPRAGMEVLAREEANWRTAVRWAVADQAYDVASALGDTFHLYLERSGRLRERNAWVAWLAEEVGKGGFTPEAAAYEQQQAWSLFTQGHPKEAIEKLQVLVERLKHTTEFDPAFQFATAQTTLGRVLDGCDLAEQAIPELEAAIGQWEALVEKAGGEKWQTLIDNPQRSKAQTELGNLAATLGDLANALRRAGRLDKALATAEKAMAIDERLGRGLEVGAAHVQCASILVAQGRYADADARYEAGLAAAHRAGDKELASTVLQHQGSLADDMGQFDRAAGLYQRALKLFQEMNNEGAQMRTCNLLGVVEQKQGRLAEARTWYERSREIAQRLGDARAVGVAAQNIGIVCQEEGEAARQAGDEKTATARFREAVEFITESLKVDEANEQQPGQAQSHVQLAQVHLLLGELEEAERHARQCLEIDERLDITRELPSDYGVMANIARARGDTAQAAEWERKRDAVRAELERRARGGGGLPAQFLQALQDLSIACAEAGFGQDKPQELDPGAESALAQLEKLPAPMAEVASFLRRLAGGEVAVIPAGLPAELQQHFEQLLAAVREVRH